MHRHKEDAKKQVNAWRSRNRERVRAAVALWRKNTGTMDQLKLRLRVPQEPARLRSARRRARKNSLRCTCCKYKDFLILYSAAKRSGKEVDHRIPLALGGRHCIKNLQALTVAEHKAKTALDQIQIARLRHSKKAA
jgi:5-methylcytosine-specific restriction endonuclease McrA